MTNPTVTIHGAAQTVTGSCFELAVGRRQLLVDCGLFQGSRTLEALNRQPFQFNPRHLECVLLTHAHLDHSGLLPRLAAEGFNGTVWCTKPTLDLLAVMLPDAAKIEEQETDRRNRRADRAGEPPIEPLYSIADVERLLSLARTVDLEQEFDPVPGVRGKLWNAGHILGATSIEVSVEGVRLLFSGDLGPEHKSFYLDPTGPQGIDHIFCESTYGDREREPVTIDERRAILETEVRQALAKGGNLVVPVFALERTQELLLDLAALVDGGRLAPTPIFIDSPLASRATAVFQRYRHQLEDVGERDVFRHPTFHFVESAEASMHLKSMSGAIILAASGMCEGGRIRYHLMDNLPRSDSTILFVGYQAKGTLGRTILEGAKRVRISGRDAAVRASIRRIDSYSAHADREELVKWLEERRPPLGSLFLVHGEPDATKSLRGRLPPGFASVIEPEIGERYELAAGSAARRLTTGRLDIRNAIGADWQNDYARLATNLKRDLQRMKSDDQRARALKQMRIILEEFAR